MNSVQSLIVTIAFSAVCLIILWSFIQAILAYKNRERLGRDILFPSKLTYLNQQSLSTLRTTEDPSYRLGIYLYIAASIFLLYLWYRLVFIDVGAWRMFGLVCWVPLFLMNTFEIREKGIIFNGIIQKWEDLEEYKWTGNQNKRVLILKLKRQRLFSRTVRTFPLSEEIYEQADLLLKECLSSRCM